MEEPGCKCIFISTLDRQRLMRMSIVGRKDQDAFLLRLDFDVVILTRMNYNASFNWKRKYNKSFSIDLRQKTIDTYESEVMITQQQTDSD
jgi:hypothetical protein